LLRHHFSHHVRAKESPAQRHREGGNLLRGPGIGKYEKVKLVVDPLKLFSLLTNNFSFISVKLGGLYYQPTCKLNSQNWKTKKIQVL